MTMGEKQTDNLTVYLSDGTQWQPLGKICEVEGGNITDDILEDMDVPESSAIDHFDLNDPFVISGTLQPIPWRTQLKLIGWKNFVRLRFLQKMNDISWWLKLRLKVFQLRRIFRVPVTTRGHRDETVKR